MSGSPWSTYWFWLLLVSLLFVLAERLRPWRPQPLLRPGLWQDLGWLVLNGHLIGLALARLFAASADTTVEALGWTGLPDPRTLQLLGGWPVWAQAVVLLVAKDLLEWGVHNLLHRVPLLWRFHQVHHSIRDMDWIGNMRFHWMEIVVYRSLTWLPLVALGVGDGVLLTMAVVSTVVGHANHSNLALSWGAGDYLLNSPRFHLWHHDAALRSARPGGPAHGCNFAIVFTTWDWLAGTAHHPRDGSVPERLGFPGDERLPRSLLGRLAHPFTAWFVRRG
jgi:sterol desaturase/sphingolipid hydroxylase (fatty acid hydroxylase superfamily)